MIVRELERRKANRLADSWRLVKRCWRTARGREIFLSRQLRCATMTLGNPGAAWSICPAELSEASVAYSFGVGEDISFDGELIARFGMAVHAFDPTPRSAAWVEAEAPPDKFVFHPYGIAARDGLRRFHPPENSSHVSHTLIQRDSERDSEPDSPRAAVKVPVWRLSTIMQMLGHARVNFLKMDIEGAEYEVIDDLVASGAAVDQLLVEFHHRWPEIGVERTKTAIRQLNDAGYRIFSSSASGEEYGFLKLPAPLRVLPR
jgi:FkbM family methyltransferase